MLIALLTVAWGLVPGAAVQRSPASPVVIPFELGTRHIFLKATVNGSRPLSFIFDTGANQALLRLDVARELNLRLEGEVRSGGAGPGTQVGSQVRKATWSLVGLAGFEQPVSFALPLAELPSAIGRDVDGIIGTEFIRQFVVEVDYLARTLTLHDPKTFRYSGTGETLPMDFTPDNHPVLTATVTPVGGQPIERRFLLDLGSGAALILHSPFVAEQQLLTKGHTTVRSIGAAGAGGRSVGQIGRVEALQIGSFALKNLLTTFSEDRGGALANPALAGNIGAQIANRFRVFLDYGRRQITLEPAATFGDPYDRAFSGIALRASGPGYHTFHVREILEHSPATDAGVREGDVIAAIDGTPASALTLTAIYEMFDKPGTYTLAIERDGRMLTTVLRPRRMV
ncbi:MAG TPA: aspartyl protease family protein [Vicinamibacterales bacterium]|nr:aspartyl protease family protein [Vicinamibacterales bacterium]